MDSDGPLLGPHGGYRNLEAYKLAEIIYDGTTAFCRLYLSQRSRTVDQMVQAARSGKQNIAEGSMASGTSKKTELKLVGVARASLEELLLDYEDFLRQQGLAQWTKDSEKAKFIRGLARRKDKTYTTYKTYVEDKAAENAANTMICVIHQANFMLDRLKGQLEKQFAQEGGFTEKLYRVRSQSRERPQ
jgi:restriction system protein